jgi:hypothetical protein
VAGRSRLLVDHWPARLKYAAWGDGHDQTRLDEHPDGAFTVWYYHHDKLVGALTHNRDEDYEHAQQLHCRRRKHTMNEPQQGVGRARRLGVDIAYRRLISLERPDGLIARSDADTTVAVDWLSVQIALSRSGAAAIGGLIELDPTPSKTPSTRTPSPCANTAPPEGSRSPSSRPPAPPQSSTRTSPAHPSR